MPGRRRGSIWIEFEEIPLTGRKGTKAKCLSCGHVMEGQASRMKSHLMKCKNIDPNSAEGQQYMSHSRGVSNESMEESRSDEVGLQRKVTQLEDTLKKFRAEVDMKMTIVEQVLQTRNELFSVQKKLLDREHALHETVLAHWKNISELAASGLSLKFSDNEADDIGDLDISSADTQKNVLLGKRRALRATLARRERRKRQKMKHGSGGEFDSDGGAGGDEGEENSFPSDFGNDEEAGGGDEDGDDHGEESSSLPKGLEKKVFVKFYSEEEPQPGERVTRTPVWKYYLREENGDSALCKLCDEEGVQSILKVRDCSTSSLHAHLKFKHKIQVEFNPRQNHGSSDLGAGDGNSRSGVDDDVLSPTKTPRNKAKAGQGNIGRPPSEVWSYFTEFILDGQRKQQCLECGQLVSAQAPRLIRHYKNCANRKSSSFQIKTREQPSTKAEPEQEHESIVPDLPMTEMQSEDEGNIL